MPARYLIVGAAGAIAAMSAVAPAKLASAAATTHRLAPVTMARGSGPEVTLVAGNVVQLSAGAAGPRVARFIPARPHPAGWQSAMVFAAGGSTYLMPFSAMPELARGMSLSPFDLTALLRSGRHRGQYAARSADADLPARTLTVLGTDLSGKPATRGMVFVSNVDNSARFSDLVPFSDGVAALTVPEGHYWAIGIFKDSVKSQLEQRLVIVPQFTVTGNTTIRTAERAATSELTMATPRPALPEDSIIDIVRPGAAGPVSYFEFSDSGISLWVSPTHARPSIGRLQVYSAQQLISAPARHGTPYEYNLAYQDPAGVIPRQRFTIRAASLATVDAHYFQDSRSTGSESRYGLFPEQFSELLLSSVNPFRMPRHQIEYMTGNPAVTWYAAIGQDYLSSLGGQVDPARTFRAGEHLSEDWNAYPLSPEPNADLGGRNLPMPIQPSAVRAGNVLRLNISPFGDSQPGHLGPGYSGGSYQLDQNGRQIAGGPIGSGPGPGGGQLGYSTSAQLSGKPSLITLKLTARRPARQYPLSPQVSAKWTWRSDRQPRITLPKGWTCQATQIIGAKPGSRRCAPQPMMTLRYDVARLAPNGTVRPGRQVIRLQVGHIQLAHASAIVGLRVRISLNDGKTWRAATVTRTGATTFRAIFSARAGSYVTVHAAATDAAGDSISETIRRGYKIAS